jgi:hypothetical protein
VEKKSDEGAVNENSYLLFIPQGNVKAIQDKLKDLGGFYNGLGYAIPLKHESFLQKLLANLPKSKIHKLPLSPGQSFSSLQQSYKAAWFQEKLVEIDQQLISLRSQYQLEDLSEKTIATLSSEKKRNIVELLQEKEKIKNSLEHAIGMEKTLSIPQETELTLEFINERSINYLLDEAPETPRLINYLDEGVPKPFIRKGITAMLVGAGGTGKTHILTQLGLAIAMGGNWLDTYPVERPGYVFLGLGENSEQDIHRLLRKTVKSLTRKWSNKNLFDPDPLVAAGNRLVVKSFTGMDASFIRQGLSTGFYHTLFHGLKMKEPKEGWSCIILDPISRFLGADAENDNASATQFIALLERFSIDLRGNPTVIFGHHMNKSGVSGIGTDQSAARGSSALTDGVRWQANLERVKKQDCKETDEQYELHQISMRPVKSNFTVMLPSQKLEKDEMGCLHALNIAPRPISVGRRSSNGK